jgi:hypothetical protein
MSKFKIGDLVRFDPMSLPWHENKIGMIVSDIIYKYKYKERCLEKDAVFLCYIFQDDKKLPISSSDLIKF